MSPRTDLDLYYVTAPQDADPHGDGHEEGSLLDNVNEELTLDDGTLEPGLHDELHAEHSGWYENTNLWVLVAFLIVVGLLLWQGVAKKISGSLNDRAVGIRTQLDEARGLREEAQSLLAEYQKRQRDAEDEAAAIIDQAKADAKALTADANRKAEASLARRTQAANDRIARAETQAVAEVRGEAANLSVAAAREIIASRVDARSKAALTDRAIAEVGQRLS